MPSVPTLHFDPFRLEGPDHELWRGAQRCHLKAKAAAVLRYLVEHPGRLVHKSDLLAAIWPEVAVSEWVLTTCIREIRHVLGDDAMAPRYIATVHRQGYRFIAPVTVGATPSPPVPAAPPPPEVLPAAPTPALLAEEYKLVTVLCGAPGAAAALAARLGAEQWYRVLQQVLRLAQEVLQRYDGTLLPPTSAGFTAVFGAPVAQEDHARRAVLAALELRQRLHEAAARHTRLVGDGFAVSLGLHSGLVVVGCLGPDAPRIVTAVGEPFDVATRLQQRAAPGTILLSAATYALVHAEVRAAPGGTLARAGRPAPVPVYTLEGLAGRHAGVAGRGPRAESPFVGRTRELALLHDHLAAARAGQGQVVGVVGEPGLGKTRLLREFGRSLAGQPVTVYTGQCLPYGQALPYGPVRALLGQLCGLVEGEAAPVHAAAVQRRVRESGLPAEADSTLLCQLLDLPVAPACLERFSPQARQARTFALLRHLVLDAAQRQLLVVVVKNLHWSDATSAAWLTSLVECLADAAVLLLVTYRSGYQPPWGAQSVVTQLALPHLSPAESVTVVQAVLQTTPVPPALLQTILHKAAGNPFFLEELSWAVRETPRPPAALGELPATIQAVLAARIDCLPPAEKQLLQTTAVIGPEVAVPLLLTIAELSEEDLQRGLAHLQAAEFLQETRLVPEPAYRFKHALTHEVAYGSLLRERRRGLHARLVEALEALAPDRAVEQVERLASHALRGEVWGKAVTYGQQAGARAFDRAAFREAVAYFDQALEALTHLPEHGDTQALAIELRLALDGPLTALGECGRRLTVLEEAETLARALDDGARLGQVLATMAHVCRVTGDLDGALVAGQQARGLAAALGESAVQMYATHTLAQAYQASGDCGRAAALLRQNVEAAERAAGAPGSVFRIESRAWLALTLSVLGAFAEAQRHGEEALRLATLEGRGDTPIVVHGCLGRPYLAQGDLKHASQVLEQGLALCRASGNRDWLRGIAGSLGYAYALQGHLAEGRALLEEAISESLRTGALGSRANLLARLSEVCRLAGRGAEAWQHARQALDVARQQQARGDEALALQQPGALHAHADPPNGAQAEAHYQQALALAEELGMRPLQAHCHRDLGTLYAGRGQQKQARAALSTAMEMYRAMEMTFWLPQTEALLAQLGEAERPAGDVS
jgi:DNA-binding winged helix-turn-helix (wHTH) protein/tetratricopeptide (TPR) repeat protein